ncbi:desaturase [Aggregicoccus sp. 17bor-14]|uniref:NAD(P)-binding protein n=1 Tax=Myxococcaceae TaxID=31 RepID=UPI00129C89A7|nr:MULTISPECIES: NAD(P)-binding protein [Myxococcaceae]MBF5041394.1 desaturase [Simulacricoccus sp. 17bor-14]MRI87178.1 desaturase [Aggregicoccus sp. 17bor-14]
MQPPARPKIPAGPSRHVYDVIVLGSQLGGALAGALLAKRGHRVLFVEHDGMGPGYEHGRYLLPYAPSLIPSLKTMPAVEEAFTELGLSTAVQRALKPHHPDLQLVLPRHRVDLHADEARRRAELAREFGDGAAALQEALTQASRQHEEGDAFFKAGPELPPDGMFETWAFRKQVRQHPALEAPSRLGGDDAASALLRGLLPFVTHLDAPQGPLALTRPLSQALRSPYRFPGGREGLRELLAKRITELGGDVLTREGGEAFIVEELSFEGGKFAGLKVLRSDTLYRGNCLVAATDAGALRRLIADKKRQSSLATHLDLSTTKRFLFTVNWVVPAELLPKGLGELTLVQPSGSEAQAADALGPLLLQQHPARLLPGKEQAGKDVAPREDESQRVICAGAFVPASARDLGEDHLKELAERIDAQLSHLLPFVKEKRFLRSAPYLDAGGVRGSRLLPHPLYAFEAEAFLGVSGLGQRTPVKNLLLAGREVLPGLGLEGELLAGMRAARLVQETLKKKDPLKG